MKKHQNMLASHISGYPARLSTSYIYHMDFSQQKSGHWMEQVFDFENRTMDFNINGDNDFDAYNRIRESFLWLTIKIWKKYWGNHKYLKGFKIKLENEIKMKLSRRIFLCLKKGKTKWKTATKTRCKKQTNFCMTCDRINKQKRS